MRALAQCFAVGLLATAGLASAQATATLSERQARDAAYDAYVRELAQKGTPKVVAYDELRAALSGHQVVVLGGYSGLDYEHPEVLREQIAALVKMKGDRAAYVIGATDGGIGRAYAWIPEIASELGLGDVQTAGIVSRNAAEWGVAPQDFVVFVDTAVDDWEVKVDGRSLMVSIAKDTGGEVIYFQGGAVSKAEIGEALERGVPVTVYTGESLAPSAAKLAKKGKTAREADGTAAFVAAPPPGLSVVTVEP